LVLKYNLKTERCLAISYFLCREDWNTTTELASATSLILNLTTRTCVAPPASTIPQSFIPTSARIHGTYELQRGLSVTTILDEEACGDDALRGAEETDLIEELDTAGVEGGEEVRAGLGVDEGATNLCADDEAVLLDAGGFFDCQRGEAFAD